MKITKVHSESNKTSNMELSAKIVKKSVTFFTKSSILDIWLSSEQASVFLLGPTLVETKYKYFVSICHLLSLTE